MLKRVRVLSIVLSLIAVLFLSACTNSVEFTINFNSNGGSDVTSITTEGSSTISLPDDPTKDGYSFAGWYWDNNTFSNPFTVNSLLDSPISSNLTVYAKWVEQDDELTTQLKSIYLLATQVNAFQGTYEEWLETVRGPQGVPGEDGKSSLLRVNDGVLEWQLEGDTNWITLFDLSTLAGSEGIDGKNIVLQVSEGFIQWQYTGDTTWNNLIDLQTITGAGGTNGTDGVDGLTPFIGDNGNWWIGENDTGVYAGNQDTIPQTGEFQYAVNSDGQSYVFIKYVGNDRYVRIPDYYNGYPVVEIAKNAFNNNTILETVILPNKLKIIEKHSFSGASSLTSIVIPNSVTSIGSFAFQNSGLQTITFEEGAQLTSIGSYAFSGASSLTAIEIPNSVTSIGSNAFSGASSLTSMTLPFVGQSRTATGTNAYFGYIFGKSIYTRSYSANGYYLPNSLTEVIITDATSIGSYAFYEASRLTSIVIPNSVTSIGSSAFSRASSLTIIYTSISSKPTNWNSNWVYNDVTVVWGYEQTVENDGLLYALSTKGVAYVIGTNESMTSNVVVLDYINGYEVIEIANRAFKDNLVIETIYIPNTIVKIGYQAFNGATNLTLVEFEVYSQLGYIGAYAFGKLSNLEAIIIPISVSTIKNNAFANTANLTINTYHEAKPSGWEDYWNPNNLNVVWSYNE